MVYIGIVLVLISLVSFCYRFCKDYQDMDLYRCLSESIRFLKLNCVFFLKSLILKHICLPLMSLSSMGFYTIYCSKIYMNDHINEKTRACFHRTKEFIFWFSGLDLPACPLCSNPRGNTDVFTPGCPRSG